MWRKLSIVLILFGWVFSARSQHRQEFLAIENSDDYDKLALNLTAVSGSCSVKPQEKGALNIFGSAQNPDYTPEYNSVINNRTRFIHFNLNNGPSESLGKALSQHVFGSSNSIENKWDVFLSKAKPMVLNLNCVVGNAKIDLSGLPVEKLKINSGNADVHIGYFSNTYNPMIMDSLLVKVDLGSLTIDELNLSKARQIVADVGLGSLSMDFSDRNVICSTNVKASVGAGKLQITIPDNEYPILIQINNSPLCHVKIPKSFKTIEKNIFVNNLYKSGADNLVEFDLNVTVGHIAFNEPVK